MICKNLVWWTARPNTSVAMTAMLAVVTATACADPDSPAGDPGASTSGAATEAADAESTVGHGTSSGQAGDSSSDEADESSTGGGDSSPEGVPASGVRVAWVEANQGVGIRLGAGFLDIPPAERAAKLIGNRPTLIRAGWAVDEGFAARSIVAHLRLVHGSGVEERFVDVRDVGTEGPSVPWTSTFQWRIDAGRLDASTEYLIELYEVEPPTNDEPGAHRPPSFPVDGMPVPLGVDVSPHRLEVTLVPVDYDDGAGCSTLVLPSSDDLLHIGEQIYMRHPVEEVSLELAEPLELVGPLERWSDLNDRLGELRVELGIAPQRYLQAVVDLCGEYPEDRSGAAFGVLDRAEEELAAARVASTVWFDREWNARALAKHLGYLQGRPRVACEGEPHEDTDYPDPTGHIVEWGWGVLDGGLRDPAVHFDVMTTCSASWVGTYGWSAVEPFIATLSSWGAGSEAPRDGGSPLVVHVAADGATVSAAPRVKP